MIKIKFIAQNQNDKFVMNRMARNFIFEENNDKDFKLTDANNFDYLIVCSKAPPTGFPRDRVIGVVMEPSWSPNWDRNLASYAGTVFVHDNSLFNFKEAKIIERPSLMFTEFYNSPENVDYFLNAHFEKTKKVNIIVSGMNNLSYNNTYPQRLDFVKTVLASKLPIEIFGRLWIPNGEWLKGPFERKLDVLQPYEFSIGIENSCEKNYISEKFFDPYMTNTVPVYYGCPNIAEIYDKDSFIALDINDSNKYIPLLEDLLYKRSILNYLEKVIEMKKRYLRKHNLYTVITSYIKDELQGIPYES
jgi:Glycosyltransferase family 10 (fucosyltransferase).